MARWTMGEAEIEALVAGGELQKLIGEAANGQLLLAKASATLRRSSPQRKDCWTNLVCSEAWPDTNRSRRLGRSLRLSASVGDPSLSSWPSSKTMPD